MSFFNIQDKKQSIEQLMNLHLLIRINIETLHICLSFFLYFLYVYGCSYTHRMIKSASYIRLFGTWKRSGHERGGVCMVFKQGLLNFRVQNENSEGLQCRFLFILCFQNICISV